MNESLSLCSQAENRPRNVINIFVEETDGAWYGPAYVEERIVATAVNSTKESMAEMEYSTETIMLWS